MIEGFVGNEWMNQLKWSMNYGKLIRHVYPHVKLVYVLDAQ
jgi:hypothetical protein